MGKKVTLALIVIVCITLAGFGYYRHPAKQPIYAVVVPHHNLVASIRATFFKTLALQTPAPKTIILISPNHYDAGQGEIQTTEQKWDLGEGQTIEPNQLVIKALIAKGVVSEEPASFVEEHGIYNILPDIKKSFPNSMIVPIIFKDTSLAHLHALEESLMATCPDCLMVASVDFSHYQPALLGELHDERTIRDLENLDTVDISSHAEVDSNSALALLTLWAKDHNTLHFALQDHTNSGVIYKNPDLEATTHVFGWYESGSAVAPEEEVSFIVGGDMMFARLVNHVFKDNFNEAFKDFGDRVFWGTDAGFANLEGAITTEPIEDNVANPDLVFKFSPDIVKTLSYLHLNAVSLANNHSNNAGAEGLSTTRSLLGAAKIQTIGGSTQSSVENVAEFKGQGLNLVVIGINLTFPGQDPHSIIALIQNYKKDPSNRVLVMPHWGVEYSTTHTTEQARAAHAWIDAGADMVIGSHPHVIEDSELYKGKPIIYSLGNLLFDQSAPGTQEGLLVAGKFTSVGLTFFALPTQSIHLYPRLIVGDAKQAILTKLYAPFSQSLVQTSAGAQVELH